MAALPFLHGCHSFPENPIRPILPTNITIYPNTLQYQELNFVSGWLYLTPDVESTSRGIIVYRLYQDEFRAYDRIPPNNPDCLNANGNLTRLVADPPFVMDSCNGITYNIINGDIFEGEGVYPLIQYHTTYDGSALRIYN